jgi:hypothetical protein
MDRERFARLGTYIDLRINANRMLFVFHSACSGPCRGMVLSYLLQKVGGDEDGAGLLC